MINIHSFIHKLHHSRFLKGSIIVLTGNFIASFLNYLYQLAMSHVLAKADFAVLSVMFSIIYITLIPLPALQTIVIKTVIAARKQNISLINIYQKFNRALFLIGLFLFICLAIISPLIKNFLHLPSRIPVVIVAGFLWINLLFPITRGILQAFFKFLPYSLSFFIEALVRLALGIFLVLMGFSVHGALFAVLLSSLAGYIFTLLPVKKLLSLPAKKEGVFSLQGTKAYSIPAFLALGSITFCYTADVILVTHFFPAEEAGNYAALSLFAKIIFWVVSPIVNVLFPLSASSEKNLPYTKKLLARTFFLSFIGVTPFICVYKFFPSLFLNLFFAKYATMAPLLFPLSIGIILLSCSYILINYLLSLSKTNVFIISLFFVALETFLIITAPHSLTHIVSIVILTATGMLISLIIYTVYSYKKLSSISPTKV